ncbi:MAG: response regulator [Balneolaceae bacterium]|nr:response regulator [Balneolaceae bacterium]
MIDPIKVLYVDDEVINLRVFELAFKEKFEVYTAKNGALALEVLNEHPKIHVVVSDMKMPRMNGIEFITQAKTTHPDTIYFILTGFGKNEVIKEAMANGLIKEYIQKPYLKRNLELTIRASVEELNT